MKSFSIINICLIASFSIPYQEEISGQTIYPMYGGAPKVCDNHRDDDLGLLLTVLLLVARNRNGQKCNCCNCCNCGGGSKTIPVPYPIPFPTNNAIINNKKFENNDNDTSKKPNSTNDQIYKEESSVNYTLSYVPVPLGLTQQEDFGR